MAGVKGRSGGPRANSGGPRPNSGGYRPGAGRKPKAPVLVRSKRLQELTDPDEWLAAAMEDESVPMEHRIEIARYRMKMLAADALVRRALAGDVQAMIAVVRGWTRTERRPHPQSRP